MNHLHRHDHSNQKFLNKIAFLDSKQREQLIPPEVLISQMPIEKDAVVLDVGAGTGFFTIPMAESTNAAVYAMDPDSRMLGVIEGKAAEKGLANIVLLQEYLEELSLGSNSVDFAMASLILHEVKSLPTALEKLCDVLKPGGHLLCLEYQKDEAIVEGPPMSIRIHLEALEDALTAAGFGLVRTNWINEGIYTVLAVKKAAGSEKELSGMSLL